MTQKEHFEARRVARGQAAETVKRLEAELAKPGDEFMPTVLAAVEFRREQYGLTCVQWAKLLGMPKTNYSDFLHGRREFPPSAMPRACRLGVPAEVLLQLGAYK